MSWPPGPAGVITSGAIGSKTAARPGGTGRGRAAHGKDVPAVDGDLDGSGHRDHARGQLTVLDGDPAPGRPGSGAGAEQSGCLAAQPRDRVPPGPS
jgi:hypothetical protein